MILQSSIVTLALVFSMGIDTDKDFQKGVSLYRELEFEEAEPFFIKSSKRKHPKKELAQVEIWLSLCRAGIGENDDARGHLNKALTLDEAIGLPAFAPPKVRQMFGEEKTKLGIKDAPPPPPPVKKDPPPPVKKDPPPPVKKDPPPPVKKDPPPPVKKDPPPPPPPVKKDPPPPVKKDPPPPVKKDPPPPVKKDPPPPVKKDPPPPVKKDPPPPVKKDPPPPVKKDPPPPVKNDPALNTSATTNDIVTPNDPPPPAVGDPSDGGGVNGLNLGLGLGSSVVGVASGVAATFFFLDLLRIDENIQLIDEQLEVAPNEGNDRNELLAARESNQAAGIGDLALGSLFGVLCVAGLAAGGIFLSSAFSPESEL